MIIDRRGEVKKHFLSITHVANTVVDTLKDAIESLLMEHSLSLYSIQLR